MQLLEEKIYFESTRYYVRVILTSDVAGFISMITIEHLQVGSMVFINWKVWHLDNSLTCYVSNFIVYTEK